MAYAFDMRIGATLQQYRAQLRLTQTGLARRTYCAPNYVSKIEQGIRLPHISMAIRFADALQLTGEDRDRFLELVRQEKQRMKRRARVLIGCT